MSRIVAFGCSNTFGQGLQDCVTGSIHQPPSKLAWPAVLGRKLNLPVANFGIPGASNLEIIHKITQTKLRPGDRVFVLWSYLDRDGIIKEDNTVDKFGHWLLNQKSKLQSTKNKFYYKHMYSRLHQQFLFKIFVREANRIFSESVSNYYHMVSKDVDENICPCPVISIKLDDLRENYPKAIDQQHIGSQAHEILANIILKNI